MMIPPTHNQKRAGSAVGHLLGRSEAGDKALSDALVQRALAFPGGRRKLRSAVYFVRSYSCGFRRLIYP